MTLGICSGALLMASALLFVPAAHGDAWNKKTQVAFHDEVKLPNGVTLPSDGEYVLKLFDSSTNRHIVQVMNDREDRVYATILAIPSERMEPKGKTVITFYETPAGEPHYIRTWYYPGDTIGQEFTYPKATADYLTRVSGTETPSTPEVALATPPPAAEARQATSGQEESAPASEATPTPPVVSENQAPENGSAVEEQASPQPPADEAEQQPAEQLPAEQQPATSSSQPSESSQPQTLPGTASNMPLAAALGLISLGAALGIRVWRTRNI
ncbi:MAG: hypothetical protein IT167_11080 [Bryobacterales bacterium]|nr:hypothetical protein [Bryobacterales bacterium]